MATEPITDAELEAWHLAEDEGNNDRIARLIAALRAARNNFAAERAAFQALSEGCKRVEAERDAARAANATLRAMLDTAETILSRPLLAALVDDPSWRDGVWPHLRAMRSIAEDVRKLIPKQDSPRLG